MSQTTESPLEEHIGLNSRKSISQVHASDVNPRKVCKTSGSVWLARLSLWYFTFLRSLLGSTFFEWSGVFYKNAKKLGSLGTESCGVFYKNTSQLSVPREPNFFL